MIYCTNTDAKHHCLQSGNEGFYFFRFWLPSTSDYILSHNQNFLE